MTEKWHPGYLLERVRGKLGGERLQGLPSGNPKDELTLCLTRSDIWEARMRINELEDEDKEKKWRAGVYFEEALATIEEQKFRERKTR